MPWSVILVFLVARSQTRSVLSQEPETTWRPSGVTATAMTSPGMAPERRFGFLRRQVPNAQRLVVGAGDRWRPSGVTATALTQPVWPWSIVLVSPVARSKTRSVFRRRPLATIGGDCHGIDPAGMALERRFGFPCRQVPNVDVLANIRIAQQPNPIQSPRSVRRRRLEHFLRRTRAKFSR